MVQVIPAILRLAAKAKALVDGPRNSDSELGDSSGIWWEGDSDSECDGECGSGSDNGRGSDSAGQVAAIGRWGGRCPGKSETRSMERLQLARLEWLRLRGVGVQEQVPLWVGKTAESSGVVTTLTIWAENGLVGLGQSPSIMECDGNSIFVKKKLAPPARCNRRWLGWAG